MNGSNSSSDNQIPQLALTGSRPKLRGLTDSPVLLRMIRVFFSFCLKRFGGAPHVLFTRPSMLRRFVPVLGIRFASLRKPFNPQPLISHLTNSNGCGNLQPKVLLTVSPFPPSSNSNSVCIRTRPRHSLPTIDHRFRLSFFSCTYKSLFHPDRFAGSLFPHTYKSLFPQPLSFLIYTKPRGVSGLCAFFNSAFGACPGRVGAPARSTGGPSALKNRPNSFPDIPLRTLESLCALFQPRVLCFQSFADSFAKHRGYGGGAAGPPCTVHRSQITATAITFRINTCKSVSKQTTLSPFRMNTCEKTRGGGRLLLTSRSEI